MENAMRIRSLVASTLVGGAMLVATVAPASAAGSNSGTFRCGSPGIRTFLRSSYDAHHIVNNSVMSRRLPAGVYYTQIDWSATSGSWGVSTNGAYYGGGSICR